MATRYANERKYKEWKETENGKRVYERKVEGKHNWYAIYYKEVDAPLGVVSRLRQGVGQSLIDNFIEQRNKEAF